MHEFEIPVPKEARFHKENFDQLFHIEGLVLKSELKTRLVNVFTAIDRRLLKEDGNPQEFRTKNEITIEEESLLKLRRMLVSMEDSPGETFENYTEENFTNVLDFIDTIRGIVANYEMVLDYSQGVRTGTESSAPVSSVVKDTLLSKEEPAEIKKAKEIASELRTTNDVLAGFLMASNPDFNDKKFLTDFLTAKGLRTQAENQIITLEYEGLTHHENSAVNLLRGQIQRYDDLISKEFLPKKLHQWETDFKKSTEYMEIIRIQTGVDKPGKTLSEVEVLSSEIDKVIDNLITQKTTIDHIILEKASSKVDLIIDEAKKLKDTLLKEEFNLKTFDLQNEINLISNATDSELEAIGLDNLRTRLTDFQKLISETEQKSNLPEGDSNRVDRDNLVKLQHKQMEEKLRKIIQGLEAKQGPETETMKLAKSKPILGILHDKRTDSFPHAHDPTYFNEMMRKVDTLRSNFKEQEDFDNFRALMKNTWGMFEFGFFHKRNLNIKDLTSNENTILENAQGDGAMEHNSRFNDNPYINRAVDAEFDVPDMDREFWGPNMGIVQKICFVAFKEMKSITSQYSIGKGYEEKTAEKMLNFICTRDKELDLTNEKGDVITINLKKEIDDLLLSLTDNPDVQDEILKLFQALAQLKLSRDNAGFDASVYLMGFNTGAFKFDKPFGGSGKPAGILSAIIYRTGKSSKKDVYPALLSFIDPFAFAFPSTATDKTKEAQIKKVKRVARNSYNYFYRRNPQIELPEFPQYRPKWGKVMKAPETVPFQRYKPKRFDDDFPRLSAFFNQKTEEMLSAGKYKSARDAVSFIVETAAKSRNLKALPTDNDALKHEIESMVSNFNTQIATAFAYLGNNPSDDEIEASINKRVTNRELTIAQARIEIEKKKASVEKYRQYHELILTAYKFFIMNILLNVPGELSLDPLSGFSKQYYERYDVAKSAIVDTLITYDSIKGFYWEEMLGKREGLSHDESWKEQIQHHPEIKERGFIFQDAFRKKWEDPRYLNNTFFGWKEELDEYGEPNDPEYAEKRFWDKRKEQAGNPRDILEDIEEWGDLHEQAAAPKH